MDFFSSFETTDRSVQHLSEKKMNQDPTGELTVFPNLHTSVESPRCLWSCCHLPRTRSFMPCVLPDTQPTRTHQRDWRIISKHRWNFRLFFISLFVTPVSSVARLRRSSKLAATLRGSRPGVQSASLIMTSLWRHNSESIRDRKNGDHLAP